jgi:hypothetical protein
MSFLHLPANPMSDNAKGIISFWFRFSQDAVNTAKDYFGHNSIDHPEAPDILHHTIPLLTFGRRTEAAVWDSEGRLLDSKPIDSPLPGVPDVIEFWAPYPVLVGMAPDDPSHIGIIAQIDFNTGAYLGAKIKFVFKMATDEYAEGLASKIDSGQIVMVEYPYGTFPSPTLREMWISDASDTRIGPKATFSIIPEFTLEPDRWHHLLLSFDFSTGVEVHAIEDYEGDRPVGDTTSRYCKIWYAIDDVNRNGKENMGEYWVESNLNGIISETAMLATGSYSPAPPDPLIHGAIPSPSYSWSGSPLPLHSGHVGIPAGATYVDAVCHCEMAELQIFTGVTLDTASVTARRAFVDADGNPVDPETAATFLGKRPEILLHGNGDWIAGNNTGSVGLDDQENILPSGQFAPTGTILEYTPEPALTPGPSP